MRVAYVILCLAVFTGCRAGQYGIGIKNATPTVLTDARVIFPDHTFHVDELVTDPKVRAHFLSFPIEGRFPTHGTVRFRTPDASIHTVDVTVPSPPRKRI